MCSIVGFTVLVTDIVISSDISISSTSCLGRLPVFY